MLCIKAISVVVNGCSALLCAIRSQALTWLRTGTIRIGILLLANPAPWRQVFNRFRSVEIAVRIVRAPATALAAKRQDGVAILSLCKLFVFVLYFGYRRRLNVRQITVCQILIKKLLYNQINCTSSVNAQHYIVHCISTISQLVCFP